MPEKLTSAITRHFNFNQHKSVELNTSRLYIKKVRCAEPGHQNRLLFGTRGHPGLHLFGAHIPSLEKQGKRARWTLKSKSLLAAF